MIEILRFIWYLIRKHFLTVFSYCIFMQIWLIIAFGPVVWLFMFTGGLSGTNNSLLPILGLMWLGIWIILSALFERIIMKKFPEAFRSWKETQVAKPLKQQKYSKEVDQFLNATKLDNR